MSLIKRLFGKPSPAPAAPSTRPSSVPSTQTATRKELLRVVLRDTLGKHGIPGAWIGCEMLVSTGSSRKPTMHMRLLIKHWDPRLLTYAVALQNRLRERLAELDSESVAWFTGMSWQYSLADESQCPELPDPVFWSAERTSGYKKAELERMMAERDASLRMGRKDGEDPPAFQPTEPAGLS